MNLSVNNFEEVEGIGEKTSNNIYEFIHLGEDNE
jgi:ERCC4-type nuclease